MKNQLKIRFIFLALIGLFLSSAGFQDLYAQKKVKKNKVRLKVAYFKIMDHEVYFNLKAGAKVGKENVDVANIDLTVINEVDGEEFELGTTTTNMKGESKFVVENFNLLKPDSSNTYNVTVSFKGNDAFKRASKSISFKDAAITAELFTKDSVNYIKATLIDKSIDSVIDNVSLTVQAQRLFKPLYIGDEFNITDKNGMIVVPIEEGIPGMDGNLNLEVVLNDSDDFGTVKAILVAPVGTPIVDESTFDQRKMWSSRNKTPLFLLIFPNLIILAMWGLITYLTTNLIKISKS